MEDCVMLYLYNNDNHLVDTVQTGASFDQKYVLGWYPGKDTIILNSKDIGIYAWRVSNKGKFESIAATAEIESEANKLFNAMYKGQ